MITDHRRLSLGDFSGRGNHVDAEVNWNSSKAVQDCKHIRLRIGDKEAIVNKDHLWSLIMMFADDDQQEEMLPMIHTPVKHYETVVNVQATNDIKKGNMFGLPLTVSINPQTGGITIKP